MSENVETAQRIDALLQSGDLEPAIIRATLGNAGTGAALEAVGLAE